MAEDLRLYFSWPTNPKRRLLQKRLGAAGVLAIMDLWVQVAIHRPTDGRLVRSSKHGANMSPEEIEALAGWDGEPGVFVRTCVDVGLIDQTRRGVFRMHKWNSRQPFLKDADSRTQNARLAAKARWNNKLTTCDSHAKRNARIVSSPSVPNPKKPDTSDSPSDKHVKPAEWLRGFERIYQRHPRHEKRAAGEKAWKALRPKTPTPAACRELFDRIDKLHALRCSGKWTQCEKQFIPLIATWLRAESFTEDEIRHAVVEFAGKL